MSKHIYRLVRSLAPGAGTRRQVRGHNDRQARRACRRGKRRARQSVAATVGGSLLMQSLLPLSVLARGAPVLAPADDAAAQPEPPAWAETLAAQWRDLAAQQREGQTSGLNGRYLRLQAQGELNRALQDAVAKARGSGLPWLRHLDGALQLDLATGRRSVAFNTIEELQRSGKESLLAQLGAHSQNDRPTANAGAVYRRQLDGGWLLGVNGFLDHEFGKRHWRASVGWEAIAPAFTLHGNVYAPLSGWRGSRHEDRLQERPASGVDFGMRYRPAAVPGLSLSAAYFRWNGASVDFYDNGQPQHRASGFRYGLEYRPIPLLSLGLEQTKVLGGERQIRVQIGLSISWDEPLAKQLRRLPADAAPFSAENPRMALVSRESRIVLKTRRKEIILALSLTQLSTHVINGRVTVAGLTQPYATVEIRMPDGSAGSASADAAGRYRYTSDTDQPSGQLVLRARNADGDQSQELTVPYVDQVVLGKLQVALLTMSPQPADRALALSGKTEPSVDVVVHFPNGESVSAKSDGKGLFKARSRRAVGQGQVLVRAIDPQTREEARTGAQYQPPPAVAPTIDAVLTDEDTGRVTVLGQAEPGSDVELTFPDGSRERAAVGAEGRYRLTSAGDVPSGPLRALRVPRPGEEEAATVRPYVDVRDKTPPAAPVIVRVVTAADTGRVTVVGQAEPDAEAELIFPDGSRRRLKVGEDGTFEAQSDGDVPAGSIVAGATDAAGNPGPKVTLDYHDSIDRTAPDAPVIETVEAEAHAGRVTVAGQAEPGAQVEVVFPDGSVRRVQADQQGRFRVTSDKDQESGSILAAATDAAGNRSPVIRHDYADAIDRTAPQAPTIEGLHTQAETGRVTVEGMAEPQAMVTLRFPDGEVLRVPAGVDGRYRATSSGDIASGEVVAQASDAAGNVSPRVARDYQDTVDKTAPAAPSILAAVADDTTGRLTVRGEAEPQAWVEVRFPDHSVERVQADAQGQYRATSLRDVESGPVYATATDAAGNRGPQTRHDYRDTVDRTAPDAPSIDAAAADPGTGQVTVTGRAEPGAAVTVHWPDGSSTTSTAAGDGQYTATSAADIASGNITAYVTDAAGNQSARTRYVYRDQVDATPPDAPEVVSVAADPATGKVTVTGTAEPGARVTLRFPDGSSKVITADAGGGFTATSERDVESGTITVQATDRAGNVGRPTHHAYQDQVDVTAPPAPHISKVSTDSHTGYVTVTGQAEPRAVLRVQWPDGSTTSTVAAADGSYMASSSRDMMSGRIVVQASDAAGNASPPAQQAYVDEVDATPPAAPTIVSATADAQSGRVTVTGRAEPASTVTVRFPDGTSVTVQSDAQGAYSAVSRQDIGSGAITARAADAAGNTSGTTTYDYHDKVDVTPPAAPVISGVNTDTQTGRVTVSGQAEPGASVTVVFSDGSQQRVQAGADGRFEAQSAQDVPSGNIVIRATDAAGNQGAAATRQYNDEIDKTPPGVPSMNAPETDSSNGRVTVRGKTEPLAWVDVTFPGGSKKTARADKNGNYAVSSDQDIASGEIRALARDEAGNTSAPATRQYQDSRTGAKLPSSAVLFELSSQHYLSISKSGNSGGRLWMLYLDLKYKDKAKVSVHPTNISGGYDLVVANYVQRNIETELRYDRSKRRNVFAIGFRDRLSDKKSVSIVPRGRYNNLVELRVTIPGEGVYRLMLNVQVYD
ncbi:Ig-like domain-containing protein [Bordetella genomosp. 12]|uniref:Inverse autotransporter beta-domain domain-containing protein n=1 Tax=Bordetella genomosp. 12 TaxID=463035 RepID=A0A261VA44_9BORD|nr:Ig-like domain-containing protein [Bordetella genomosp. 12]OZI70677.1 hypothetical protein CAL22_12160 [Bordetella genomosp. 12]